MLNTNSFTMNSFIALLIELSFSIFFLILFMFVHYTLCNKTKLNTKLNESKAINFWYFFLIGVLMSMITFAVSRACIIAINDNLHMTTSLIALIVAMTFAYNKSVQIGAFIPMVIAIMLSFNGFNEFNWAWCSRVILIACVAVVIIVSTFFKTKKWLTYLIALAIILGCALAIIFGMQDSDWAWDLVLLACWFVISILFYWIINRVNSIFNRMSYMAQSNLYTDEGYVIPSMIDEQFKLLIKNNNLEQALVVTFRITKNQNELLKVLSNKFKSNQSMLFKTEYGTYGVVLTNNDYRLNDLNQSYEGNSQPNRKSTDPLIWLENEIKKLDVIAFVSVYGIHSYDISELIWFNQYAIKQFDKTNLTNKVQIFNSNMLNNQIKDEVSYAQLKQKLNIDEIEVVLEVIEFKNNKQYVYPRFYWAKEFTCNLDQIINRYDSSTSNALLRALAIKSIEAYVMSNFKSKPLLINYPINQLFTPFFATNEFIKKLQLYGLNKESIVLCFECKKLKVWSNALINNFKEFEDYGIKYMFVDLANTYPLTLLKPLNVILDDSIIQNEIKFNKAISVVKQYKHNLLLSK